MPKTENFQWYVEQVGEGEVHGHALNATLASGRSKFQSYAVVDSRFFGKMLVLDGDTQSSALDEYIYHEALVHPACAAFGGPESALVLGGGEGATLRELLRLPSMRAITMIDIDGDIVRLCREHLPEWSAGAFEDSRVELIIGDAKEYIHASSPRFDVILGDLTEPLEDSPSYGLPTVEMYSAIRARLNPGGYYALQTSMAGPHNFGLHARMIATLRKAFAAVAPYSAYVPAFDTEWGFALCGDKIEPLSEKTANVIGRYVSSCGDLRFYDTETHWSMFSLPKYLRDAYKHATPLT